MARGGKQPGAGRPAGSTNVNAPDIKALCRRYTGLCVEQLVNIAQKSKIEGNRIAAINQILDRGFGKPTQAVGVDPDMPVEIRLRWLPNQDK